MKTELASLEKIQQVEPPTHLFEKVTNKIEQIEKAKTSQFKFLAAASVIAIFFNLGFVFQYYTSSDSSAEQVNPYSYISSYQTIYE
ncbi:MAG: hypothetical protein ABF264_06810 [Flavobacteriales bacterium]